MKNSAQQQSTLISPRTFIYRLTCSKSISLKLLRVEIQSTTCLPSLIAYVPREKIYLFLH